MPVFNRSSKAAPTAHGGLAITPQPIATHLNVVTHPALPLDLTYGSRGGASGSGGYAAGAAANAGTGAYGVPAGAGYIPGGVAMRARHGLWSSGGGAPIYGYGAGGVYPGVIQPTLVPYDSGFQQPGMDFAEGVGLPSGLTPVEAVLGVAVFALVWKLMRS